MKQEEFQFLVNKTVEEINRLLVLKGGEYAGSEDRLANFKRGAALTGCSPLQVLFVYMSKHYDAVATFVRDSAAGLSRERSEPIEGRLDDLINYCILAKALLQDERNLAQVEANLRAVSAAQLAGDPVFYGCGLPGSLCHPAGDLPVLRPTPEAP